VLNTQNRFSSTEVVLFQVKSATFAPQKRHFGAVAAAVLRHKILNCLIINNIANPLKTREFRTERQVGDFGASFEAFFWQ
jgi:hypothetical protein